MYNITTLKAKSKTKKADFSPLSIALTSAIFLVIILILTNPTRYAQSVINGLKLFFVSVLPGLLPFVFLTKLITNSNAIYKLTKPFKKPVNKIFRLSGECFYPFFMSLISGYPIGSTITSDLILKGRISESEATRAALLSSTSGPIFVIGAVGAGMLNNAKLGLIIYLCNILAVILTSILISFRKKAINNDLPYEKNQKSSLNALAKDTCLSLMVVGFYVAFFSLIIDILKDLKILIFLSSMIDNILAKLSINSSIGLGIMSGIVEMTNGAKVLSYAINPLSLSVIGFIIGFSGFSIIMQSISFLSNTKVKVGKFILGKFLHGLFTFLLCLLVFSFMF